MDQADTNPANSPAASPPPAEPVTSSTVPVQAEAAPVIAEGAPAPVAENAETVAALGDGSAVPEHEAPTARKNDVMGSIQSLAITVVIAMFVITFIVQAFQIPSESMEDTLLIGDYLLVDKVHYAGGGIWGEILPYAAIHRGDIVVFRYPVHPQQHFVKRVIGLPGDHVRLKNKQVLVNGRMLREPYVVYRSTTPDPYRDDFPRADFLNANVEAKWWLQMRRLVRDGELVVPPGQYFVLGDNRDESLDSRYWGFVPRENIIGRPLLIYWSMRHPERIGPIAENPGDRLLYFAYSVTHLLQDARWGRTFRVIK